MTYRLEAIPMTLSHLRGHSYCKPFKCYFSYSCAAVECFNEWLFICTV